MTAAANPDGGPPIRLLLVDDSPLAIEVIRRMLAADPQIRIVGTAANGAQALERIAALKPDVVCTDLHMPTMDGLQLTREVMARHPLPILVMSTSLQPHQSSNIFAMLDAGALDILAKPRGGLESDFATLSGELARKIRVLSGVKVFRRRHYGSSSAVPGRSAPLPAVEGAAPTIVGIGSSTGGPQALETILRGLPGDFPLPVVCVQHIAMGFLGGLVEWLSHTCQIAIRMAEEGQRPEPGKVYFAHDDRHLELDAARRFRCSSSQLVEGHRPSVSVALGSLARAHGKGAIGVLLTGMGQDGAQGMLDIARAGGLTIAQDEATSVVFGMPKAAIDRGAARLVLPVEEIAPALVRAARKSRENDRRE